MAIFVGSEDNASPAASGQQATLIASASGDARVTRYRRGRSSTSTTVTGGRDSLQRSTGGATPTAGNVEQHNTRSSANSSTYDSAWTTAPTLSGNPLVFPAIGLRQEIGPSWRTPRPWAAIYLQGSEQLDAVSSFTSSSMTYSIVWQESRTVVASPRLGRRPRRNGLWGQSASYVQYCHKTGTGAYDVTRVTVSNLIVRTKPMNRASMGAWGNFYGAAPAASDRLALTTVVNVAFPFAMEV